MVKFRFQRVANDDVRRMEQLYRLRYQVYCIECGFESPEDHPRGLEYDKYDAHASHFCAMVAGSDEIIGTVRIILPSDIGFPLLHHCQLYPVQRTIEPGCVGEISRLAISKDFRRREIDKVLYSQHPAKIPKMKTINDQRHQFESQIVAGLYQCVYHESRAQGLKYWYAVMVKGLSFLLGRWGITWREIGPEAEYHGLRAPYLADIAEIEKRVLLKKSHLLDKPPGWID
ncbi:PEP-CTERM/exosortase system-associated acyltransferase [Trichloromonas sp.]|uniref:PEP-CTERM/exosortase system-associated acyltransferase n=1 Tax=Trichloromonas sp. TaxID=3069249 RepID=UPI003D813BC4